MALKSSERLNANSCQQPLRIKERLCKGGSKSGVPMVQNETRIDPHQQ